LLLTCSAIQAVNPVDVRPWNEMPVGIDRDLNLAMPHLLLHVSERGAFLNQEAPEGVSEVMESETSEAGVLETRQEVIVHQIVRIEDRSNLRGKDQVVRNACSAGNHCR